MDATTTTPTTKPARYLTEALVAERYQICRITVNAHVKAGKLPAPIRLGTRKLWCEAELDHHDAGLKAARYSEAA